RPRAGEGHARDPRPQPPRGAQRTAAGRDHHRDQLRVRPVGRDRGRGDLLVARPRAGDLRRPERTGPADAAGPVAALPRRRDRLQPVRGPALRLPRPAGADGMSTVALPSARRIAWRRRRRSAAAAWRQYRTNRAGMVGLVTLVLFTLLALAAPLLAD